MERGGQSIIPIFNRSFLCGPSTHHVNSLSPTIWSSVMMAIAGMGDALLYAYLPVKAIDLGMSAMAVGILLSINKFVRLFFNRWVAFFANKWGIKITLFSGVIFASFTTLIYALNPDFWIWVLSRIIWGLAYSSLRFSSIQFAGMSGKTARALGIGKSLQETGPLLAYWTGPFLINFFSGRFAFTVLGLATLGLLPLFYLLPDSKSMTQNIRPLTFSLPGISDIWVFISSFIIEGVLVVGISRILNIDSSGSGQLLIVSALYISSRRFLNILISPISGWLIDKWRFSNIFNLSCHFMVTGILVIAWNFPNPGILLAFLGSALNTTLLPIIAMVLTPEESKFEALTKLSTSHDIGSATGALSGLALLANINESCLFGIICAVLIAIWYYLRKLLINYDTS